jgi:excinuclease ABC subunit A
LPTSSTTVDRPSADNARCSALKRLRDIGVPCWLWSDEETILEADHLIDMGPGAGVHGGEL